MIDKQQLLQYWAGELLAVKMELEKIAYILQQGFKLTREQEHHLDDLLQRKQTLEKLIEEIRKQK